MHIMMRVERAYVRAFNKVFKRKKPIFGGDVIPVGYGTSPLHYI